MEKQRVRAGGGPRCQLTTPRKVNRPRWPSKKPEWSISGTEAYPSM